MIALHIVSTNKTSIVMGKRNLYAVRIGFRVQHTLKDAIQRAAEIHDLDASKWARQVLEEAAWQTIRKQNQQL